MPEYKPLQERAYEYLMQKIQAGDLQYNTIYSETKLARELGFSRTPVKDALVRLCQDRIVDIIPSKGFRLHQMSAEDVWCTYQARTAVEGFCALHLSEKKDAPEGKAALHAMAESLAAMERSIAEEASDHAILAHDLQFHRALVQSSGNPELIALFASFRHRLFSIAMESFRKPGRPAAALSEHRAIYDAIRTASAPSMEAYSAVMGHMAASRDIALRRGS